MALKVLAEKLARAMLATEGIGVIWKLHVGAGMLLDLAIGDRAGHVTAGTDQEPLSYHKFALESATHLSLLDRSITFEQAALGDLDLAAIMQGCLYAAVHHAPIGRT